MTSQLFITTHSSSVLNRLGIEALQFLGPAAPVKLDELSTGTVGYFKKLPGFDTLRLVLADKIVLSKARRTRSFSSGCLSTSTASARWSAA